MATSEQAPLIYGTAWKEEDTQRLVELAIAQGFRAIDTANQRKHYYEEAVGRAIRASIERGAVSRRELFLQTKFTFRAGQDHRLPYDPHAPIATQVAQSFASSLAHLGVDSLDSYVLHGPSQGTGLGPDDWAAWRAMEAIKADGKVKALGVSNISLEQLQTLVANANSLPRFVQNRCYAIRLWDKRVREFCLEQGLIYQGFSLLTANREAIADPRIAAIARRLGATPQQVIFCFAVQSGMLPLTGTTSVQHMQEDLGAIQLELTSDELATIETIAVK